MEQNHNSVKNITAEKDSDVPPLTKWEGFYWEDSAIFPLTTGHRGVVLNNNLIIHGGFNGEYSNTTQKLNLDTLEWQPQYQTKVVTPTEFTGRQWHSLVQYKNKLYTFGGAVDVEPNQFGDVWEFDPAVRKWKRIEIALDPEVEAADVPLPRYVHSAVVYENGMYIYGGKMDLGSAALTLSDLWRFDLDTHKWTKLEPTGDPPAARRAHLAIVFDRKMLVFGGWNGKDHFNDAYYYHFKKNQWTKIEHHGDIPPPRQLHTAVIRGGKMILFGGKETKPEDPQNSVYTGDIYEYDFSTSTWKKFDVDGSEVARGGHVMCEYNNNLYILGGYDGNRKRDMWCIKLPEAEYSEEKVRSISARLKRDLKMIYQLKEHSDLVVEIEGQSYHLHSALLSVRCPELLLQIQRNDIIIDAYVSKHLMNILVEHIYSEEFRTFRSRPVYFEEAREMYDIATILHLKHLAYVIEEAASNILDLDNLSEVTGNYFSSGPTFHKRYYELLGEQPKEVSQYFAYSDTPQPNLAENLLELLKSGEGSDITIMVNERQFKLHKFILYRRCPFFKGFAEFNQRATGCDLVHKPQMPLTAFESLLQYVYGAKISCDDIEDYFWLLQEASYYMIDDKFFYEKVVDAISENITKDNANHVLDIANKFQFDGVEDIKQAIHTALQ